MGINGKNFDDAPCHTTGHCSSASANVRWNQRPLASANASGNVDELTETWWGDIAIATSLN